jgi:hypothetical protein
MPQLDLGRFTYFEQRHWVRSAQPLSIRPCALSWLDCDLKPVPRIIGWSPID